MDSSTEGTAILSSRRIARITSVPYPLPRGFSHIGIFIGTFALAFAIPALTEIWLSAHGDPVVREFRATLSFRSALLGDTLILPLMNVIIFSALREYRDMTTRRRVSAAMLLGFGLTALLHWVQASEGLVNWTMPHPFHWTILGYVHALYMAGQLSLIAFFFATTRAASLSEDEQGTAVREAQLVALGLIVFTVLLLSDYSSALRF